MDKETAKQEVGKIEINEIEDLSIVDAMINKIKKNLNN